MSNIVSGTCKHSSALVALILLTSFLPQTTFVSLEMASGIVLGTYGILTGFLLLQSDNLKIRAPKWALLLLVPIWLTFVGHLFRILVFDPSVPYTVLARPYVFVAISIMNIFLIPGIIDSRRFFSIVIGISTAMAILWSPGIVTNARFLIYDLSSWGTITIFGIEFYSLSFLFRNPNAGGYFMMVAVVATFARALNKPSRGLVLILLINTFGLAFTKSRGAYLGTAIGIISIIVLLYWGPKIARLAVISGSLVVGMFVASVAGLFPDVPLLGFIDLAGRREIWSAAFEAVRQKLFGYGPIPAHIILDGFLEAEYDGAGIHSSYLRLFLSTGVIGGISYAIFVVASIYGSAISNASIREIVVFGVLVAISVEEIFEGNTFFGLSMASVLWAITLGFGIKSSIGMEPTPDDNPVS